MPLQCTAKKLILAGAQPSPVFFSRVKYRMDVFSTSEHVFLYEIEH